MTQPFIGQIQPFGFNFAPKNWAMCNGQILAIAQNTALFSLLGTMYGGNGQTTFALPNLQSRVPLHSGSYVGDNYTQGELGGEEQVTLTLGNLPAHDHGFLGTANNANDAQADPGSALAKIFQPGGGAAGDPYYAPDTTPQPLNPASIGITGGNQPHNNLQPYLAINWCICMFGVYPSRN
ncbi:MAG: phage tail protein [Propylenella sp.]